MRRGRWAVVLPLLATVWVSASAPEPARAGESGGRIALGAGPQRVVDTRASGSGPVTSIAVPAGLVTVTAADTSPTSGHLSVRACGASPSSADRRTPYQRYSTSLQVVADANTCAYSTRPVHFVVDRAAVVHSAPNPTGAQYVDVEPAALKSGRLNLDYNQSIPLALPPLPAGATAVVVSVHESGSGHVNLARCGSTPSILDYNQHFHMESFVDIVALGASDSLCAWGAAAPRSAVDVEIELIGYLASSGPDAMSVPPLYTESDEPTLEPGFAPINPHRVLDTRNGIGCVLDCDAFDKVGAYEHVVPDVGAYANPWTTAVVLNVTSTESDTGGFLTVWPCDEPQPDTSSLNWNGGETRANLVVVDVDQSGGVCMVSTARTHLIVDVMGTYGFIYGSQAEGVPPSRLLDTRNRIGVSQRARLEGGRVLTLDVTGRGAVPEGVDAITMNVTAVEPLGDGFLTVWPCDRPMPNASNVNYPPGRNVPNLVTVGVSAQGTVCFYTYATTHLLADVAVWYGQGASSGLVEVSPRRILDTRNGVGAPERKVERDHIVTLQVRGRGGVPGDAASVMMNMTITNPEGDGFLTVWPCDRARPDASNLNFEAGDDVPNLVSVTLSAAGTVCMSANARTDILADVAGYLTSDPTTIPTIVLR